MRINKIENAFTLIELLIVMTIIAILSALSFFAISGARESARDARRKADLEQIASALEMYKADCGSYPASISSPFQSTCTGETITYLENVPKDPLSGVNYIYCPEVVGSSNLKFKIYSHLEESLSAVSPCSGSCNPNPCRYFVSNP